jgi:hypothetical protein
MFSVTGALRYVAAVTRWLRYEATASRFRFVRLQHRDSGLLDTDSLIFVCFVVSYDRMTIGDELGRMWEEAVITSVMGLGSVITCVF